MTEKFHVNSKGEPGKCSAQSGGCPFGSEAEHHSSKDAAAAAYEKNMKSQLLPKVSKISSTVTVVPPKVLSAEENSARGEGAYPSDEILSPAIAAKFNDISSLAASSSENIEVAFERYPDGPELMVLYRKFGDRSHVIVAMEEDNQIGIYIDGAQLYRNQESESPEQILKNMTASLVVVESQEG